MKALVAVITLLLGITTGSILPQQAITYSSMQVVSSTPVAQGKYLITAVDNNGDEWQCYGTTDEAGKSIRATMKNGKELVDYQVKQGRSGLQ